MNAQVVFFDIGNTLAATGNQSARRQFAGQLQLTEKETRAVGRLIMTHPAKSPDEIVTTLVPALPRHRSQQIRTAVNDIWKQQTAAVQEIPGARDLLQGLKNMGLNLGVISNTWHPSYKGFRLNCPQLTKLLDFSFLSYLEGWKKPSQEIFEAAVRKAGCPAEACWMVGDSYELDLEPARILGMRTLWVLCRPECERPLLAEILRGEKPGPDWAVQALAEILPLFQNLSQGR